MKIRLLNVLLLSTGLVCAFLTHADDRPYDVQAVFKMSPKDVMRMRKAGSNHEEAVYTEIRELEEKSEQVEIQLSPGEITHEVNLIQRAPTAISFVDATGTPWPIRQVKGYDGELFGIAKVENNFGNSAFLHGKLPAGLSYFSVFLESLSDPITVRVLVSSDKYHKSKIFKVMKIGPATEVNESTLVAAQQIGLPADVDLNNILFGVTPFKSVKLQTTNQEVLAWKKGDDILVRTKLSIFSPGHLRIKHGTNGYAAYRLPKTSRLYASTEAGNVVKIRLMER